MIQYECHFKLFGKNGVYDMKKVALSIGLLLLCLVFSACDPSPYQFEYQDLHDNTVSVALVQYENPGQKAFLSWVPDHSSDLAPFQNSKVTVLAILEDDKKSDFLKQLSQAEILSQYYAYDSPKGVCIRISYSSGDFLILNCNQEEETFQGYIGTYSESGEVIDFIGCFSSYGSFESLVDDFFVTAI